MADMASNKPNLQHNYYLIIIAFRNGMVTEESILLPVMKTLFFKRFQKQQLYMMYFKLTVCHEATLQGLALYR